MTNVIIDGIEYVPKQAFDKSLSKNEDIQIGDWVECIDNSDYELFLDVDERYKVKEIYGETNKGTKDGAFLVIGNNGKDCYAFRSRFKKTTPPIKNTSFDPNDPFKNTMNCNTVSNEKQNSEQPKITEVSTVIINGKPIIGKQNVGILAINDENLDTQEEWEETNLKYDDRWDRFVDTKTLLYQWDLSY